MRKSDDMVPQIVQLAYDQGITNIGQLSREDKEQLDKFVESGYLDKYQVHDYPVLKWHYGMNWLDFASLFVSEPDYITNEESDV